MDEVANLMHQEKTRIKYYFDEDTYAQIMTSMKTIFIKMHMDTFLRVNMRLIYKTVGYSTNNFIVISNHRILLFCRWKILV